MKTLGKIALVTAVTAISVPAMACDMHGPNGMHWTPTSQWLNFSPKATTMDPALFGDAEPAFLGDTSGSFDLAPPPPRRIRPTFSSAADRASRAAKTRLIMTDTSDDADKDTRAKEDKAPLKTVSAKAELESDAQPIR